jgi:RHS repeat-associated protein
VWYIYTGSRLQAIVTPGGGKYFYHFDKTGNTVALTDGNGNVAAGYAYEPFGRIVQKTGTVANPFTFVGAFGVMDEGGGLYFMKNRYFDAQAGKFLQKDPIGIAGGFNLYAYASNNPVDRIDPYGLDDKDAKLPGEGQESVAGFSGVTGQVEYRLPGEDEETWHMVKSGTRLPVGAHIRTQENSKAIISFNDGSMYVLSSESEVILCKPPEKESKIKMVLGNIWENIKKVAKDGTLEVEMNQAIAGTRDDRGDGY